MSTFDSTKNEPHQLLGGAARGELQLPDFQRGWVWDDDHVRDLLASVSRSFPIGTVMLLETGGDVRFKARPLQGAPPAVSEAGELVLDGQQRLTSLFQALISDNAVETRDAKGKRIKRWYYIDIEKAIEEGVDREDAILSVPEDRVVRANFGRDVVADHSTPAGEHAAKVFPLRRVFEHHEWARGFRQHHGHDPDVSRQWDVFEQEVVQRFRTYQLPVIRLNRKTPKEAVCLVFERVNTGGVSLTVFELLTASFAAVAPPGFELRTDWAGRKALLAEEPVLRSVSSTDFLQAVSLLASLERRKKALEADGDGERAPAVTCKRRDMLKLGYEEYAKWAEAVTTGFQRAGRFLHRERIFETNFLPYGTQIVPLAAVLALRGDEAIEKPVLRNRLARWYWCGVFGELYGSTVESRFANDLLDLQAWLDEGSEPRTIQEANFAPDRLLTLRTRRSAAYRGLYVLLLREGAKDFRTGETSTDQTYFDEALDIHHVFPKKWCEARSPEPVPAELFDSIVNKTPLTARTNRIVGGHAPSKYLEGLERNHGVEGAALDESLRTHFIDPDALRRDDFDAYFEARRSALLRQVSGVMGKPLMTEGIEDDGP